MNDFLLQPMCCAREGADAEYSHTFGGELSKPLFPPGGSKPCHLLYTIDTLDPKFPIRIPGSRFLPLVYCIQYDGAAMAYRVLEEGIKVDYFEKRTWDPDYPYADYPSSFPERTITLDYLTEDYSTALHQFISAWESSDFDGVDAHSRTLKKLGFPFTQFGGPHYIPQTIPDIRCYNPDCSGTQMDVFGVIWNKPVHGVYLWDNDADYRDSIYLTQIIYQICNECSSIHVCNRSL